MFSQKNMYLQMNLGTSKVLSADKELNTNYLGRYISLSISKKFSITKKTNWSFGIQYSNTQNHFTNRLIQQNVAGYYTNFNHHLNSSAIEIPLLADYRISKKISLFAGIGFGYLFYSHRIISKSVYNNTSGDCITNYRVSSGKISFPNKLNTYELIGVEKLFQYKKKTNFKVQVSYRFDNLQLNYSTINDPFNGNFIFRNNILAVGLVYKLKH
jgi:hypothetical protein